MGHKCSPQIMGLVRGEPQPGKKHRANGLKILQEAGSERYSTSDTLDRTRSKDNVYTGFRSGGACWEAMCNDADMYRIPVKLRDGSMGERGLPHNAVIGWALIFNPPAEMCEDWTDEDYDKFYSDSYAVMEKIEPRLFRAENVRMTAEHHDEGLPNDYGEYSRHRHDIGAAIDKDGKYCGNLIDAKLCVRINENYPRMMRDLGWDLEDLDTTDFARMGKNDDGTYKDPEYRAERQAMRKQSGRKVNKFIADKAQAIADAYQQADDTLLEAGRIKHAAAKERNEAKREREAAEDARRAAEAERATIRAEERQRADTALRNDRAALQRAKDEADREREQAKAEREEMRRLLANLKQTKVASGSSYYDIATRGPQSRRVPGLQEFEDRGKSRSHDRGLGD